MKTALPIFVNDYEEALVALKQVGVRVGGTRLHRYLQILQKCEELEAQGDYSHQSNPSFLNAIAEASEIIDVATLKLPLEDREVSAKLKKIAGGPETMAPDRQDTARDHAFEFSTAAMLSRMGTFHGFSSIGGDLEIGPEGSPLECKRLSSPAKLERRLREARDQLDAVVAKGRGGGIVAVDVSKPIRAVAGALSAADDTELIGIAEKQLTRFIALNVLGRDWVEDIATKNCLGLMFRLVNFGVAGKTENVRRATVWQAFSLHHEESDEDATFLRLAQQVGPQKMKLISWPEIQGAVQ